MINEFNNASPVTDKLGKSKCPDGSPPSVNLFLSEKKQIPI